MCVYIVNIVLYTVADMWCYLSDNNCMCLHKLCEELVSSECRMYEEQGRSQERVPVAQYPPPPQLKSATSHDLLLWRDGKSEKALRVRSGTERG